MLPDVRGNRLFVKCCTGPCDRPRLPVTNPRASPLLGIPLMMSTRYDQSGVRYDAGWRYDSGPTRKRTNRMIKPKLELNRQADADLLTAATAVKNAMTTNAAEFPNSAASVTALSNAITAFVAALQAAVDGKVAQQALVDAKDADRAVVEAALRTLAGQVNEVAQGDINVIHDAGMQGSNEASPVTMTQVQNLSLAPSDHEGELLAEWEAVRGARYYDVQISTDTSSPPNNWQDKTNTTKSKCRLNDTLVSGTKAWVRVRAAGANDKGAWSDVAWKTVP